MQKQTNKIPDLLKALYATNRFNHSDYKQLKKDCLYNMGLVKQHLSQQLSFIQFHLNKSKSHID